MIIHNSTFEGGVGDSGSTIDAGSESELFISNSTFRSNYGDGGAVRVSLANCLTIMNSKFAHNIGKYSDLYLKRLTNQALIEGVTFIDSQGSVIFSSEATLNFIKNEIYQSQSPQQSSLELDTNPGLLIFQNTFKYLNVKRIFTISKNIFNSTHQGIIQQNQMQNIQGRENGIGIALSDSSYLQIQDNSFTNLTFSALSSNQQGGAIYVDELTSNATISNNAFNYCQAQVGGALRMNNLFNTFKQNNFSNNKASIYGNNIASIPVSLRLMAYDELPALFQASSPRNLSIRNLQLFQEIRSGGTVDGFYLVLVDEFGNIVTSQFGKYLTFSLAPINSTSFTPNYESHSAIISNYGVFDLQNIIFFGEPGSSIIFRASTDAIDLSRTGSQNQIYQLELPLSFRHCIRGESFTDDGRCEACPIDKYLFSIPTSPTSCQKCPNNALCLGGDKVTPLPGYWRPNAQSLQFLSCFTPTACLGSSESNYNPLGHCLEGYRGVLCAQCQEGFVRNSSFQCAKCPEQWKNILLLLFILLVVTIAIVLLIKFTLKTAGNKNSGFSVFFKIISSHFQLIVFAISLELEWPSSVKAFHSTLEPVANVASKIVSIDCFLGTKQSQAQNVYIYLSINLVLPLLLIMGTILYWKIKYSSQRTIACSRSVTTIIILFFLIHPSIAIAIFNIFNCRSIDSNLRLLQDLDILCYQGAHVYWSVIGGSLGLVVWVVGIPWLAWHLLREHKLRLQNQQVRERFGFLYNGYRIKRYYWESVVMLRKVIMIFISVFLRSQGTRIQALTVFLFLLFAAIFTIKQKPYMNRKLNNLELLSLVTSCVTIYCGFFFLSHKISSEPTFDPSKDCKFAFISVQLSDETKWFFFTAILFSNLAFLVAWASVLAQELKGFCHSNYPKCYLCCCLCNRKELFKIQEKASKYKIQHEYFVQQIQDIRESKINITVALDLAKSRLIDHKFFIDQKKFSTYIHHSRRILNSMNFAQDQRKQNHSKIAGKYRIKSSFQSKDSIDEMNISVTNDFFLGRSENTEYQFIESTQKQQVQEKALEEQKQQKSRFLINDEVLTQRGNRLRESSFFGKEIISSNQDKRERNNSNGQNKIQANSSGKPHIQDQNHQILSFFQSLDQISPDNIQKVPERSKTVRSLVSLDYSQKTNKLHRFGLRQIQNQDKLRNIVKQNKDIRRLSRSEAPSPRSQSNLLFYPRNMSSSNQWEIMSFNQDEEQNFQSSNLANQTQKKGKCISRFKSFKQTEDSPI